MDHKAGNEGRLKFHNRGKGPYMASWKVEVKLVCQCPLGLLNWRPNFMSNSQGLMPVWHILQTSRRFLSSPHDNIIRIVTTLWHFHDTWVHSSWPASRPLAPWSTPSRPHHPRRCQTCNVARWFWGQDENVSHIISQNCILSLNDLLRVVSLVTVHQFEGHHLKYQTHNMNEIHAQIVCVKRGVL